MLRIIRVETYKIKALRGWFDSVVMMVAINDVTRLELRVPRAYLRVLARRLTLTRSKLKVVSSFNKLTPMDKGILS